MCSRLLHILLVDCRRQRATEAGKSPYVVVFDSFTLRPKGATFQLHNTVSDAVFQAQLFPLQDNTIRLKVNEESPLVLRYQSPVGDVLVEEPQTQRSLILFHLVICALCWIAVSALKLLFGIRKSIQSVMR